MRAPPRTLSARDESGFTLIELMVVVLIIGILVAIALPTFLGARQRAADRRAETHLRTAFTAARVYFIDNTSFLGIDAPGALQAVETSMATNVLPSAIPSQVTIRFVAQDDILLVTRSTSGAFVCMAGDTAGQIRGIDTSGVDAFATIADCQAATDW